MGWSILSESEKALWEKRLSEHEKKNPQPVILSLDGEPLDEGYQPQIIQIDKNNVYEEAGEF